MKLKRLGPPVRLFCCASATLLGLLAMPGMACAQGTGGLGARVMVGRDLLTYSEPQRAVDAQQASSPTPQKPAAEASGSAQTQAARLRWSYGVRLRVADISDAKGSVRARPALGVAWGRWRFGTVDQDDVGAVVTTREPSLGYQLRDDSGIKSVVGLRLHNLSTGQGAEGLGSGPYTLRARLGATQQLSRTWAAFGEGTVDLLGRGDGYTLTAGLAKSLARGPNWGLSASAGVTWGNATHWRTARGAELTTSAAHTTPLGAGPGSVDVGLTLRHAIGKRWGMNTTLSTGIPAGQIRERLGGSSTSSLSVALQRYSD